MIIYLKDVGLGLEEQVDNLSKKKIIQNMDSYPKSKLFDIFILIALNFEKVNIRISNDYQVYILMHIKRRNKYILENCAIYEDIFRIRAFLNYTH